MKPGSSHLSSSVMMELKPRKRPVQARSEASVEAMLDATVQVLLKEGRARLTTTRVARRAGVSVGTLYQYFPNKSSLLQALLRRHLNRVAVEMERVCAAARGLPPGQMAEELVMGFVRMKFRDPQASVVMYGVSDEVGGAEIAREMHARSTAALAAMLASLPGGVREPEMVAEMLQSAMAGVSRAMLERGVAQGTMAGMERELRVMVGAYLWAAVSPEQGR